MEVGQAISREHNRQRGGRVGDVNKRLPQEQHPPSRRAAA